MGAFVRVWFLGVLFLLIFSPGFSLAGDCPRPKPKVSYQSEIKATEYIRSESVSTLTDWQKGHSIMAKPVLGVGGGAVGTKLRVRYRAAELPDGRGEVCVLPVEVHATFYAEPQIHIASNYARGTCEYGEILAHEQKHIKVLQKFHREYRTEYDDVLRDVVGALPAPEAVPMSEATVKKEEITDSIMQGMSAYTSDIMKILSARQQKIDTLQEYRRVMSKCDNWEKKL